MLTRFVDVMYAFPRLLFVILVMSMLGAGLMNIFIAIGLTGWVGIARQTRAQVLAIKEKEFVEGARALGAGFGRVLIRHVLPNALTPIVVAVTFGIPEAIFTEAALSFIGVGINPPTPSWGQMVGEGQQYLRSYWHLCVFPSIAIARHHAVVHLLRRRRPRRARPQAEVDAHKGGTDDAIPDLRRADGSAGRAPRRRRRRPPRLPQDRGRPGRPRRGRLQRPAGVGGAEARARARSSPRSRRFRYGGGGWCQNDPSSHDFNKDLYCTGVPALWAGLMKFNADFQAGALRGRARSTANSGRLGVDLHDPQGLEVVGQHRRAPRGTSSSRGSASSIRPRGARTPRFLYDIKNGEAFNKKQVTDAGQVGVRAKDDWTLEVTLEGPRGYFPVLAAYLAALPGHQASVEKHGDKWTEAGNIVSNGPFTLEAWEHNKQMVLKKNPHFFGAKDVHPRQGDRSRSSRSRPARCRTRTTSST